MMPHNRSDDDPEREIDRLLEQLDPMATRWLGGKDVQVLVAAAVGAEPEERRDIVELIAKLAFHEGRAQGRRERAGSEDEPSPEPEP